MSAPFQPTDPSYLTTAPIMYQGSQGYRGDQRWATGFYFAAGEEIHLITCRHCIDFLTENSKPLESVRIHLRNDADDLKSTEPLDLTLVSTDGSRHWKGYPDNELIDLVAIPLRPPVIDRSINYGDVDDLGIVPLTSKNIPSPDTKGGGIEMIHGGSQAMILGYPFKPSDPYYPTAKTALISTPYGEQFMKLPRFLTDANTQDGLSGAPILTVHQSGSIVKTSKGPKLRNYLRDQELIGIHSGTQNAYDVDIGLNEAWYSYLIEEMVFSR